ncbi:MAG: XdhC family protein [Bacteroidota bacterium]
MFSEFLHNAQSQFDAQEAFAMAMVVRRKVPSSGKPGDKALIKSNGQILGWIGGGCTRGIIIKEGLAAIQEGKPRLVRISPDANLAPISGAIDYKMTCQSGGTVEVYIEPVLPQPQLIIMGKSHIGMALAKLAKAMDYEVTALGKGVDPVMFPTADRVEDTTNIAEKLLKPYTYIVVCTQGEADEISLENALRTPVPYVAFVASRRKANGVFNYLRQAEIPIERLQQVKTPAGLDIGAKTPEEVAVSILAQIIQELRSEKSEEEKQDLLQKATAEAGDLYINPVCGVPVQKSTAKHVIDYEGESYYFCCDGCKVSFEKEPAKYAVKA